MSDANATILVIDDDPALRASIGRLLRSLDLDARLFASISEFLEADPPNGPHLPGARRQIAGTKRP